MRCNFLGEYAFRRTRRTILTQASPNEDRSAVFCSPKQGSTQASRRPRSNDSRCHKTCLTEAEHSSSFTSPPLGRDWEWLLVFQAVRLIDANVVAVEAGDMVTVAKEEKRNGGTDPFHKGGGRLACLWDNDNK